MKPNRIAYLRRKKGLSMQKLAARVDTSQQQIDRLEKGQRRLTVDWMERISDALNCAMMDLLNHTDKERDVQHTAKAKVIGAIDFGKEGELQEYGEGEMYMLLFGRPRHMPSPRLFGLNVSEGNDIFSTGTELILSEVARNEVIQPGKYVLCADRSGKYFLRAYPRGSENSVIKARVVKVIQDY